MRGSRLTKNRPSAAHHSDLRRPLAAVLLCIAVITSFWGFFQLDLPLVYYMRSLHIRWLERAGDIGNRLGSGAVLALISGMILTAGLLLKQSALRTAGLESLLAHAVAGLAAQAAKHVIGRPRPRLMHGESAFLLGPSFEPGMDSFPSGHAAASFAVATVLARRFPSMGWLLYGLAGLVAVSRIVRGSHFPTDVMAGAGLGACVGYVVASPLRVWRSSLFEALRTVTPFLVGTFGLIWITMTPSSNQVAAAAMALVGGLAIAAGVAARLYGKLTGGSPDSKGFPFGFAEANVLIALGVALSSGSRLVTLAVMCVSVAYWIRPHGAAVSRDFSPVQPNQRFESWSLDWHAALGEGPLIGLLAFIVFLIHQLKGLLPLLP